VDAGKEDMPLDEIYTREKRRRVSKDIPFGKRQADL
jgi:hypothetical protein